VLNYFGPYLVFGTHRHTADLSVAHLTVVPLCWKNVERNGNFNEGPETEFSWTKLWDWEL